MITWAVIMHLAAPVPFRGVFFTDTVFVPNERVAIETKTKIDNSRELIDADPNRRGWTEIAQIKDGVLRDVSLTSNHYITESN